MTKLNFNKILITGGAGFIGSNFCRYMMRKYPDIEISMLDALTYAGNPDNFRDLEQDSRFRFIHGDIRDKEVIEELVSQVDAVVNFAAETHVDRSLYFAGDFVETDVVGTYTLLEAARKCGVERFLHISTDEVYGSIEQDSFNEEAPLNPSSPYSASKGGGDLLMRSYFVTYKLPILITRSSNNFGPYQYPEKLIPLFITNAIDDKPLPLYGDGLNVRDWLFVQDNCEAIETVLYKGAPGEIYNIGGDNERTNNEITKLILKLLNKPETLIQPVKDRPGHDRRYSIASTKVKKLGWTPRTDFETAMKTTVDWYVQNQAWWRKLKDKSFDKFYNKHYGKDGEAAPVEK
ncbi:dTDP-glucose 4,6-dehydratase [bacterium]|nr:dTDP-glucose 4,6-dehydratase [bacterium]